MGILQVKIRSFDHFIEDAKESVKLAASGLASEPTLFFPDIESLSKIMLAPNRLAIIDTMAGIDAISIRELARRVNRDFRGVHSDVQQLLNAGVIDHEGDKIIFPYDGYHVEFSGGKQVA